MPRATPALDTAMGVVAVLSDHWTAIESDFARFYGLDLARCCFGPDQVGMRRLYALISTLPPSSTLAQRLHWSWDDERELTATLVELTHDIATSSRALVQSMSGKRYRGPKEPLRWPRPAVPELAPPPPAETPKLTIGAVRSMMLGIGR
jgi:hypothetical protein